MLGSSTEKRPLYYVKFASDSAEMTFCRAEDFVVLPEEDASWIASALRGSIDPQIEVMVQPPRAHPAVFGSKDRARLPIELSRARLLRSRDN